MTRIIHQPHDKLFRSSMADIRVAKDFFTAHLPETMLDKIDLNTLVLQNGSFIDEAYQASEADLLYSVKIDKTIGYIYILCEHQSEIDEGMAFRLLVYMIRVMELHLKQNNSFELPLVYPLVIYTGETRWDKPIDIFKLFGDNEILAKEIFFNPYQLIDVARVDDTELKKHLWCGVLEFALKYRNIRNLAAFFDTLFPWIRSIEMQEGENFCRIVLNYVVDGIDADNEKLFVQKVEEHLSGKLRGEAMTLAQRFEQKGRKEGIHEVALRLLEQGFDVDFIAKMTGLEHNEVPTSAKITSI